MHKHRVEQLGGTYLSTMAPLAVSGVGLSAGSLTTAVVLGFCLAFFWWPWGREIKVEYRASASFLIK